jgi:adenosylcobinamide-GDP ribazoletransferase
MKSNLICFCSALRFLTILPVTWNGESDTEYFSKCAKYFAAIGLLIGVGGSFLTVILASFLPASLLACAILFYLAMISGFLHLDGLADTADGFLSSRPKEQILVIMRDSRIGAMGVISLVFLLLFKYAALLSIPIEDLPGAILYIPLAGRCALVLSMAYLPYAREEGGLGRLFYLEKGRLIPAVSIGVLVVAGFLSSFHLALLALCALLATTFLFGIWCTKTIGGATGDTLGAVCELTETAVAFILAVYLNV